MTVTVGGTNITFNDATTQTTAPVNTNANVNSITAGTGISVNASTGAVTISATGGGTVTSVATGNGLSGGTITTSGTLVIACPSFNSVGSYAYVGLVHPPGTGTTSASSGSNYSPGTGKGQLVSTASSPVNASPLVNNLSGSWKWMGGNLTIGSTGSCCPTYLGQAIACRVS
jgi:hypothetical protein